MSTISNRPLRVEAGVGRSFDWKQRPQEAWEGVWACRAGSTAAEGGEYTAFEAELDDREARLSGGQAEHSDAEHIPFIPVPRQRARRRGSSEGDKVCEVYNPPFQGVAHASRAYVSANIVNIRGVWIDRLGRPGVNPVTSIRSDFVRRSAGPPTLRAANDCYRNRFATLGGLRSPIPPEPLPGVHRAIALAILMNRRRPVAAVDGALQVANIVIHSPPLSPFERWGPCQPHERTASPAVPKPAARNRRVVDLGCPVNVRHFGPQAR